MTKIKICGLSRPCDISYVNEAKPDYCGFIINFPKSRRNVTISQLKQLRSLLDPAVVPVGVFVNEALEQVASLLNKNIISVAQLHGNEDENYIRKLSSLTNAPIIKAFVIFSHEDAVKANRSAARHILADGGAGTGKSFDWTLLKGLQRPFMLAGGLTPENIPRAIKDVHPWAVDLSSGVESDGFKDREKILAAVTACRNASL